MFLHPLDELCQTKYVFFITENSKEYRDHVLAAINLRISS